MRPKKLTDTLARTILQDELQHAVQKQRLDALIGGLLTPAEQIMLAQRLFVARLLASGWSYRRIRDRTGASPNTVAAIDRWLKRENPRYRRLISLPHHREAAPRRVARDTIQSIPGSIKDLYQSLTGTALW